MIVTGKVKKNSGRGKKLGFPTANLVLTENIEDGIYTAFTRIDPVGGGDLRQASVAFVGASTTFGETERRLEVYILDFMDDVYGLEIEVELIQKIRDHKTFADQDELIIQMKEDERVARDFFATYNDERMN